MSRRPKITTGSAASSPLHQLTGWQGIYPSERRDYADGITITQDVVKAYSPEWPSHSPF